MAQPRAGPPPVPPRIDLGETEENIPDSQEHVVANPQPSTEVNGHEIATPEPVVPPTSSSNTSPNASKPRITAPPPIAKPAKPVPRKEAKARPTISIISARPMDQNSSLSSVQLKKEGNDNNNQQSANTVAAAQVPMRPPELKKPSKPAPFAPKKPPPKQVDNNLKRTETPKKLAPVPNLRSKTKTSKKDTGSVFYIDTAADNTTDTISSNTPSVDNSSNQTVQKPKHAPSQPNVKSKPTLPAPRKPKSNKDEPKAETVDQIAKVKPPDKVSSKPKLKPTIITAKTPKQLGKTDEVKVSKDAKTSSTTKAGDDDRPSRPSFPPSAATEELNKSENQPERPNAPPNTLKEEQVNVEMKREQKKGEKDLQSGRKRPKSKPPRPPMAKESSKLKPSRPPPAKPNDTRKSPPKTKDVSNSKKVGTVLAKPSGPSRAEAKFDYTGERDDDLTFKAGDTIMLTSKIDDDWLVGYLESNVMHQGLFPSGFVEIIVPLKEQPNNEQNKKEVPSGPYAIAIHDFQGQSETELSFSSGETIILLERINVEWLRGKLKDSTGIFPANFVQIEHDLPPVTNENAAAMPTQAHNDIKTNNEEWCEAIHDYQGEQSDELSFVVGAKIKIIERVSQDWFNGEYSGKSGIFPASFVQVISDAREISKDTSSTVTAVHDYPGENSDDLSFKTGDKIKVIERVNSDWLMGECNGKQGLFPASFVEDPQSESPVVESSAVKKELTKDKRMAKAIHDFTGENSGELHFSIGDVIQILREIDGNWSEGMRNGVSGIFPTAFVEIQPLSSKDEVYAKALYDFAGESEGDLPFKAGDTIQILDHVNDEWCSGSVGGKTGHFPSSFVQILS